MSLGTTLLRSVTVLACLGADAASQTVLQSGDIGVVTSTGFCRLRAILPGGAPVNNTPASAFGGLATLAGPSVDWEPGSDSFLVSTDGFLFRVTILSDVAQTVTDLTPNLGGPAMILAMDVHPGTNDVYLYDAITKQVFRCSPPFALGMTPNLVLATPPAVRTACVDSRDHPPSVVVANSSLITRVPLDGGATIDKVFTGAGSLDSDPTSGRVYFTDKGDHKVDASTGGPNLVQNLNIVGMCAPVALRPTSVMYNPLDLRAYVFAEDGLNPNCFFGGSGPNQVITLPPAIGPILPQVLTNTVDSGITGDNGDIALVLEEFAFPSPYGFGCEAPSTGKRLKLDANGPPTAGYANFALEVSAAPAGKPVFLLVGVQPAAVPLPWSCTALVVTLVPPLLVGATDGNGKLTVPAPMPAALPTGLEIYLQAATKDEGQLVLSNGLQLHVAH